MSPEVSPAMHTAGLSVTTQMKDADSQAGVEFILEDFFRQATKRSK